jgi:hypothetical protein
MSALKFLVGCRRHSLAVPDIVRPSGIRDRISPFIVEQMPHVLDLSQFHGPGLSAPYQRQAGSHAPRWLPRRRDQLVLAPIGAELGNKSEKQIERLLVPVVAGAFCGTSSG